MQIIGMSLFYSAIYHLLLQKEPCYNLKQQQTPDNLITQKDHIDFTELCWPLI